MDRSATAPPRRGERLSTARSRGWQEQPALWRSRRRHPGRAEPRRARWAFWQREGRGRQRRTARGSDNDSAAPAGAGEERLLWQIRSRKATSTVVASSLEDVHDFANLLVLEQTPDQLCSRIFPRLRHLLVGQQHLRLDAHEARGHLQIVRGFVETESRDAFQELLGDACDGNVLDVDLLVANEREEQVERTRELRQLDDEYLAFASGERASHRPLARNDVRG